MPTTSLRVRNLQPEIMDDPSIDPEEHRQALKALARVNRISLSSRSLWPAIRELCRARTQSGDSRPVRVLDIATGGGDVPVQLWLKAHSKGYALEVSGCDFSPVALGHAREFAKRENADVSFFQVNLLDGPIPSGYDVITTSLFLHHLDEAQALIVLRKMRESAGILALVNDLARCRLGWLAAYIGTRLLSRSPMVHVDGPRSVEGAFKPAEALGARTSGRLGQCDGPFQVSFPVFIILDTSVMIEPTLSLDEAASRTWDALVVGAGPAGSMAARELARQNASVLLVERSRFPRYKVCGGCLNPRSLCLLKKSGLGKLTTELGAIPLSRLRLGARGSVADVYLPRGAGVSRELFDTALVRATIAAGSDFLPGTTGTLLPADGKPLRQIRLRHANRDYSITAKVVLAAGGLGSRVEGHVEQPEQAWEPGSRIGAGVMIPAGSPGYEVGTIYMACAHEGYVGQVVVEDGRIDAAAALDPIAVKAAGGIGELASKILKEAGFPPHADLTSLPWKGTPHLTRQAPRLGGERLFTLGDAAGYIEPFTGEGMAWALAGAASVAPLALQTIREGWDENLLTRWQATYRREVTKRQGVCRLTAGLLRRPITTQVLVRTLGVAPWISRPFLSFMYRA